MLDRRSFLYADRALTLDDDLPRLALLRSCMLHLGIDPGNVSIIHPGELFMLLGFRFVPTTPPRPLVDLFLDDEIGVPYVSTPALQRGPGLTHLERGGLQPQASYGRDPGDENTSGW